MRRKFIDDTEQKLMVSWEWKRHRRTGFKDTYIIDDSEIVRPNSRTLHRGGDGGFAKQSTSRRRFCDDPDTARKLS